MTLFSRLVLGLAWIAAALFVASGVMLTWEVIGRNAGAPTTWAAELSQMCLIWGTLLGMPWALAARRHIAVEAVMTLLPARARHALDALAMLAVAAFSALVTWKGWEIAWDSFERGRTAGTILDPPMWVIEVSVPFGFAMLFVQALIEAARSASGTEPATGVHE